jgi:hypothetical protein
LGVRDLPHAMIYLVKTYVTQRAMYASQVLGPDVFHLSPCGNSILQSKLAAIFKRHIEWCCVNAKFDG